MNKNIFKPGDVFKFKNKEYIVIQNYGSTGLVKENIENGMIIKGFIWNQAEDSCEYIKTEDNYTIQSLNKEYENFFKKYKL